MTEEEEAATSPDTFACLEDFLAIELWTQTLMQHLFVVEYLTERLFESLELVVSCRNFLLQYLDIFRIHFRNIS